MKQDTEALLAVLRRAPVVPVLIVDRVEHAIPLAKALVAGGLPALEVTMRTPAALEVIRAMSTVEGAIVGAGTVLDPEMADAAVAAGAKFMVSPGATETILAHALKIGVPLLPGVATAGEAMRARDAGYRIMKFFPAGPAGGPVYLKALASPLADVLFCPTGGVSEKNAPEYLALPNVVCVGGSWVAPADAMNNGDWGRIEDLARAAMDLAV
ncbi:bifunctional 4-hydroxy-2-oxoglutarate aldolase/2-dehydro-3-deoxy-phosphogluconate aldolase [Methylobrevis albus]|uniref:Bifunctional 4-hydroxy-2-oxoglutarate aldolase/2-dehydro-3-deoxy-phosphogluconate aldolase n=1 Tax=Methylobrevis albus TaxID=2793297 RepID=A0A931MZZ2_9HYPH|nr:bifunctional 4-hydroxy-2-oxoglutarate aldolase/2-dehydro-3-deoxy-phosphogluconate aldolase [Methylobrevis albus]MBH0239530.1 bifunctional 4-hydroxy-2-oxoglutarate aldolase/2-dehydro-3-deoxy-phosphogluconate aldolase [Methylobrevis albus]